MAGHESPQDAMIYSFHLCLCASLPDFRSGNKGEGALYPLSKSHLEAKRQKTPSNWNSRHLNFLLKQQPSSSMLRSSSKVQQEKQELCQATVPCPSMISRWNRGSKKRGGPAQEICNENGTRSPPPSEKSRVVADWKSAKLLSLAFADSRSVRTKCPGSFNHTSVNGEEKPSTRSFTSPHVHT